MSNEGQCPETSAAEGNPPNGRQDSTLVSPIQDLDLNANVRPLEKPTEGPSQDTEIGESEITNVEKVEETFRENKREEVQLSSGYCEAEELLKISSFGSLPVLSPNEGTAKNISQAFSPLTHHSPQVSLKCILACFWLP